MSFRRLLEEMTKEYKDIIWDTNKKDIKIKKVDRILKLIKKIWKKYPDLRLCQLIGNCFIAGDNYYKEDDVLEKVLKERYNIR